MIAAHRYAQAILDIAKEKNTTEEVYSSAINLLSIIKSNRELYNLLKSPLIKSDKKEKIIDQLFQKSIHPILSHFISILCRRRRENILPEILNAILLEYKRRNNIITVQLITAFQFDEKLRSNITDKIRQFKPHSKVELQEHIDESIIGGFILKTDDQQIDASVKTQLQQLYQKFIQTNSLN